MMKEPMSDKNPTWEAHDIAKDRDAYEEYERAGVMPGNLENDRLLGDERIEEIHKQVKAGEYIDRKGLICPDLDLAILDAQIIEDDKWWNEKLVEKFNQWADERIEGIRSIPPFSDEHQQGLNLRIDAYKWAKVNLARLVKEANYVRN